MRDGTDVIVRSGPRKSGEAQNLHVSTVAAAVGLPNAAAARSFVKVLANHRMPDIILRRTKSVYQVPSMLLRRFHAFAKYTPWV